MLTAKGEEVDRVVGLEMGADDYITNPSAPESLLQGLMLFSGGQKKGLHQPA